MTRITPEPIELSTISSADNNGHFNIVGNATFYGSSMNYGALDGTITCDPQNRVCNFGTSLSCTYSLSGADAASFEIIDNKLRLKTGTTLNFNAQDTYLVTINNTCDNINHPQFTLTILSGVEPE
jgi:hypothetical protein